MDTNSSFLVAHVASSVADSIYNFQAAFSAPSEFSKAFPKSDKVWLKLKY